MKKLYTTLTALCFSFFGFSQVEIEPFAPSVSGTYIGDFNNFTNGQIIPDVSADWTEEGNTGTNDWIADDGTTITFGGFPLYAYAGVENGEQLTLISPSIDFGINTNSPTLEFRYWLEDGTTAGLAGSLGQSQLEVMYKEGAAGSWNVVATYNTVDNQWHDESVSLAGAGAYDDIYVGFRVSTSSPGSFFTNGLCLVDEIVVKGTPNCSNSTNTISETACDSYTVPSGDETYTASQTNIKDTIPNMAGCDSLLTINLTMGFSNTGTDMVSACDSLVWIDGNTYYTDNNSATHILTNQDGCDSVVTLDLTVTTLDLNVTSNDPVLTADQSGAAYVWLNCADSMPVSGANNQAFTATANGDYAVEITLNGCKDTSNCYSIAMVSLEENEQSDLLIYPNPTEGEIVIDFGGMKEVTIRIFSADGRELIHLKQNGQQNLRFQLDEPKGVYLLEIRNENELIRKKLIKQ